MKMTTDLDLLREYAQQGSEKAFTLLVTRHLDLVYSTALRQVRSSQLAEEIAQSVFTDLARNVRQLRHDTVLAAWLYQVTRRTALNVSRAEGRRQAREQIAVELADMNATSSDWTQIEPWLDEAMETLDEPDRAAILLRYFENKSLRDVGETLGVGEDAAQKRVSRAVERLREFFSKRNVTVGASGLAVPISTNAVQAAPVGLAAAIFSAATLAGAAFQTSTALAATKTIAMTTLQKTLITAALVVAAGAGIYEKRHSLKLQKEIQSLRQQTEPSSKQIQQLQNERDDLAKQLSALHDENERLNRNTSELLKLRNRVSQLQSEADAAMKSANDYAAQIKDLMAIPPVKKFVSMTQATVSWNQALVTGGWKTPSGKRTIVLTTLRRRDNPKELVINSKILEFTEQAGQKLGLDRFNFDKEKQVDTHVLEAEQAEAILNLTKNSKDVEVVSSPSVLTTSGVQSSVSMQDMHSTSTGEAFATGPTIDLIPTISTDGNSVNLITTAQMNYLLPNPLIK